MSSVDPEDRKINTCKIIQAENGGYLVVPVTYDSVKIRTCYAAVQDKTLLCEWLLKHFE